VGGISYSPFLSLRRAVKLTKREYSELCNNDAIICIGIHPYFTVGCIYRVVESLFEHPFILNDEYRWVALHWESGYKGYPCIYSFFNKVVEK
jgi:hypothetical protein